MATQKTSRTTVRTETQPDTALGINPELVARMVDGDSLQATGALVEKAGLNEETRARLARLEATALQVAAAQQEAGDPDVDLARRNAIIARLRQMK